MLLACMQLSNHRHIIPQLCRLRCRVHQGSCTRHHVSTTAAAAPVGSVPVRQKLELVGQTQAHEYAEALLGACEARLRSAGQRPAQDDCPQELHALLGSLSIVLALCACLSLNPDEISQTVVLYARGRQLQQQQCGNWHAYAALHQHFCQQWQQLLWAPPQTQHLAETAEVQATTEQQKALLCCHLLWHVASKGNCCLLDPESALSPEEQQLLYADLRSREASLQQDLVNLVQQPSTAPQVDLDPESLQVVLDPVQQLLAAQQAAGGQQGSSSSYQHAPPGAATDFLDIFAAADPPAASEPHNSATATTSSSTATNASTVDADVTAQLPSATTADDGSSSLSLTLELVQLLLQHHPSAEVRQQVYAAGVLQRLDGLVAVWQQLADVRRRLARCHQQPTAAAFHLQHTLLATSDGVRRFLLQLEAALRPAAQQQLQQLGLGPDATAWEIEFAQAQVQAAHAAAVEQYMDHLHLPTCLCHLSDLLQQLLGVQLVQVPAGANSLQAAAGDDAIAFEVWDTAPAVEQSSVRAEEAGVDASDASQAHSAVPHSSASSSFEAGTSLDPSLEGKPCQRKLRGHILVTFGAQRSVTRLVLPGDRVPLLGPAAPTALPLVWVTLQSPAASRNVSDAALGLWEACHEMGHALHFCLSASSSNSSTTAHSSKRSSSCGQLFAAMPPPQAAQHGTPTTSTCDSSGSRSSHSSSSSSSHSSSSSGSSSQSSSTSSHASSLPYHLQAPWLPVELLELPSSFLEHLVLSPAPLAPLACHRHTGEQLPQEAAEELAAFIRGSWYSPVGMQHMVQLMLVDQELLSWTSRPGPNQAAAAWSAAQQQGAVPRSVCLLQQLRALPRVVGMPGQGYGYLVGWYLSLLLWEGCWYAGLPVAAAAVSPAAVAAAHTCNAAGAAAAGVAAQPPPADDPATAEAAAGHHQQSATGQPGRPVTGGTQFTAAAPGGDARQGHPGGNGSGPAARVPPLFNPRGGAAVRLFLFEQKADQPPRQLLTRLLQEVALAADGTGERVVKEHGAVAVAAAEAAGRGVVVVNGQLVSKWMAG